MSESPAYEKGREMVHTHLHISFIIITFHNSINFQSSMQLTSSEDSFGCISMTEILHAVDNSGQ